MLDKYSKTVSGKRTFDYTLTTDILAVNSSTYAAVAAAVAAYYPTLTDSTLKGNSAWFAVQVRAPMHNFV